MTLPAGDLRHRITFQRSAPTRNAVGEVVPNWTDVVTVWAKLTNKLRYSDEAVSAGVKGYQPVRQFDVRPLDVDHAWRVLWEGDAYNILNAGTINDGDRTTVLVQRVAKDS